MILMNDEVKREVENANDDTDVYGAVDDEVIQNHVKNEFVS